MMKKYLFLTFLLVLIFGSKSIGQDLHYTQFYNTPMNFNPSLTGIYNGDQRYMVSIRDQWRAVIPYFTVSGSFDMKFYPKKMKKSFLSAGVIFNYDQQGDSRLNLSNLSIGGSYSYVINKRNLLTAGALIGFSSRGFSMDGLTWDEFYDPITHTWRTSGPPSLEEIDNYRFNFLETGAGLNYRWQKHSRTHITLGAAGFHLTRPAQDFNTENTTNRTAKLHIRSAVHGVANIKLVDPLDIQVNALWQHQQDFEEYVLGGLLKVYLSQKRGRMFEFHVGSSYRFGRNSASEIEKGIYSDAIIPTLAIQYNDWYVGFNYDITISPFGEHLNHRGGPELHISYIVKHVQPLKAFKLCPIF